MDIINALNKGVKTYILIMTGIVLMLISLIGGYFFKFDLYSMFINSVFLLAYSLSILTINVFTE